VADIKDILLFTDDDLVCGFKSHIDPREDLSRHQWMEVSKLECTDSFAEVYKDKILWSFLFRIKQFPEEFIEKVAKTAAHWDSVSAYQRISSAFIDKHSKYINWDSLCLNVQPEQWIIDKYRKHINFHEVSKWWVLSARDVYRYKKILDWESMSLLVGKTLPEVKRAYPDRINWKSLSQAEDMNYQFLKEFGMYLDWDIVSKHMPLDENLMREFKKFINWEIFTRTHEMSFEMIRKFRNHVDWRVLTGRAEFIYNTTFLRSMQSRVSKRNALIIQRCLDKYSSRNRKS